VYEELTLNQDRFRRQFRKTKMW